MKPIETAWPLGDPRWEFERLHKIITDLLEALKKIASIRRNDPRRYDRYDTMGAIKIALDAITKAERRQ